MLIARQFGREIEVASRLAREAGSGIMKIYATDFAVRYKAVHDPVTEADQLASHMIVDGLRREFPEDLVISEEEPIDHLGSFPDRVWYVDPLDGTREFIKRNGEFAVMIGLAVEGVAQVGVVFSPVGDELYAGIVDQDAWLEKAGQTIPLRVSRETRPTRLRLVSSRSHRHRLVSEIRRRLGISEEYRIGSVGIKVGLLVTRQADIYLEPSGMTKVWDSCAPEAILRAAGGRMTDLVGTPLRYSPRDARNRQGLVATNAACHDMVIASVRSGARERP